MKLMSSLMTPGGGMISVEMESGKTVAYVFYGKEQGLSVISEITPYLPTTQLRTVADDLEGAAMPDLSKKAPLKIEGAAAETLRGMSRYAASMAGGRYAVFGVATARSEVFSLFISEDPRQRDGLLGYVDQRGMHHIAVFSSKEQAQSLIDTMAWLPSDKKARLTKIIKRCELPRRSKHPRLTISGELAGYLNCAWEFTKQQRTAN